MNSRQELEHALEAVRREYGEWAYDIPLPFGVWTRGNLKVPHTRLRRIVQIVNDLCRKPLSDCRVLDLGCLDGLFSIEFAKHGATTVGVEIREANITKALFCQEVLGLRNLHFRQDDVRNISAASYGRFDAIVCSGILYHLPAVDAIALIGAMHSIVDRVVVIDTHIALKPVKRISHGDDVYWGVVYREHAPRATAQDKANSLWASADNSTSFWFTRPSLVNLLAKAGFSSVYECFVPAHVNFGKPGLEHRDRCTFVAVKDSTCEIVTSPAANSLQEEWPEDSLSYWGRNRHTGGWPFCRRVIAQLRRMIGQRDTG